MNAARKLKKRIYGFFEKTGWMIFMLLFSPTGALAGVGDWITTDDNWAQYIQNAIKVAQGIAIALGILAGIKLFTAWMSGSEDGGRDKGALIKWGIGFFVIIVFFAFVTFLESSILGN